MRWSCWLYPLLAACSLARADKPLVAAESGSKPPAARGPCELVLSTKVVSRGRFQYNLQVTIENAAAYDLQFVVPDRCPAGPLEFEGLPEGYGRIVISAILRTSSGTLKDTCTWGDGIGYKNC